MHALRLGSTIGRADSDPAAPGDNAAEVEIHHAQAYGGLPGDVRIRLVVLVGHGHPGQDDGAEVGNPDHVPRTSPRVGANDLIHQRAFERLTFSLTAAGGREKSIVALPQPSQKTLVFAESIFLEGDALL